MKLRVTLPPTDPYESARLSGLRYVSAVGPGIRRRRSGRGFTYVRPDGTALHDREDLRRIASLVIPPAWQNVWICPLKAGHLQAVGYDARGRKQYRYHPLYRKVRDATKFTRMVALGLALPKVRERVEEDLKLPGLPKEKVLATVVRLLEQTSIRVGNEEYRKQNESFGLTTLRNGHAKIDGETIRFRFKGKSGQMHDVALNDRRLAKIVSRCQCIPGHELFTYVEEGEPRAINSGDVNEYLREITGGDFTAKDFRTWNGTREAALALEALGPAQSETAGRKNLVEAVKITADRLGNRPATCRKYYIHPFVFDAYQDGTLLEVMRKAEAEPGPHGMSREEVAVMKLLASYRPGEKGRPAESEHVVELLAKSVA